MTHYTKVIRGIQNYVTAELRGRVKGSMTAWLIGGAAEIAGLKAEAVFRGLAGNPMITALGIIDGENIDADMLLSILRKQAQQDAATINLGLLGTWTFNAADVDALTRYIQGA